MAILPRWHAILKTGLDNATGNKKLHYALAKFMMRHEPQAADQIEYHLQRSFTNGDANYDAQLLHARQLYAKGDVDGAKKLCSAESRSSVDCALRLTSAAGLAGLGPSESLAP